MALPYLLVGVRQRGAWVHLLFTSAAMAVSALAVLELAMMHAQSAKQLGQALQWLHLPVFVLVVAIVAFVRLYFGTGRWWLGATACLLRLVTLIVNFAQPPNLNFREITSLRRFEFLGEMISLPEGIPNPWTRLAQLSSIFLLAFVVDASVSLWRKGEPEGRRRAVVVGGGIAIFITLAAGVSAFILETKVPLPYFVSFPFLAIIAAMGLELGYDLLRSAQLARQLQASEGALRESEHRMELAASAAELGLWVWETETDAIWATDKARALLGFAKDETLTFESFLRKLHPEDRLSLRAAVQKALENGGDYRSEYRILRDNLPPRWLSARGRVEFNGNGQPVRMRGVSIDIMERKQAEAELRQNRDELAHVSRVALMGELAASLAHELNQPLTGIVTNAQVGQRILDRGNWSAREFHEILQDIADDGKRAGDVIRSMRNMVKKGAVTWESIDLNEVAVRATRLANPDALARGCQIRLNLGTNLPAIQGVRIQLKQVLLNLIINAFDAMQEVESSRRVVVLSTMLDEDAGVRVSVRDFGIGLPAEAGKVFEQFYSTKSDGLGMGLVIARSIVEAHGGRLFAENAEEHGACFHFRLPVNRMGDHESPQLPCLPRG